MKLSNTNIGTFLTVAGIEPAPTEVAEMSKPTEDPATDLQKKIRNITKKASCHHNILYYWGCVFEKIVCSNV